MAFLLFLALPLWAQTTTFSGRGLLQNVSNAPPSTYAARTDVCELGTETGIAGCAYNATTCPTCTGAARATPLTFLGYPIPGVPGSNGLPVPGPTGTISSESGAACNSANPITQPTNNQYLCGINTTVTDPDLHGQLTRATDYSLCGNLGCGFDMSSTSQQKFWAVDSSKLFIQNTGGARALLAFNSAKWGQTPGPITPSSVYGQSVLGNPAFSGVNPHIFYTFSNSNENVVIITAQTGTCQLLETLQQTTTGATVKFLALNPSVLMVVGPATGTADASDIWTGETSGCTVTPNSAYVPPVTGQANTPNFNAVLQGTLNDATQPDPTQWTVSYQLLFAFNYTASMIGSPAASYFPTSATSCLPANYNANWNGTFQGSADDSTFSTPVSDNGQDTSWGLTGSGCASSGCTGPTLFLSFIRGHGCRVWNTHTDHVTGDDTTLPLGQMLDGQKNYITGTIVGEPVLPVQPGHAGTGTQGALLTQDITGATTEFKCKGNLVTGITPPSALYTYSQYVCGGTATSWRVGVIYGTPDATHAWRDGLGNSITPSPAALPQPVPYYYPAPMHDGAQGDDYRDAAITKTGGGGSDIRVLSEQGGVPSAGLTTITLAASGSSILPNSVDANQDEQKQFYNLTGGAAYLNCLTEDNCPKWTVYQSVHNSNTFVIVDSIGGTYSNSETTANCNVTTTCPSYYAAGPGYIDIGSYFSYPNYWQVRTIINNTCTSFGCDGHAVDAFYGSGRGANYYWFNKLQPSTPCLVSGFSPCPNAGIVGLLTFALPEDEHGWYPHGSNDIVPLGYNLTHVCGQSTGQGSNSCYSPFTLPYMSEIIAVENSVTNNAPGVLGGTGTYQCGASNGPGCHANYGSGPAAAVYRFTHTFGSGTNWEFNAQNNIGNVSPNGQYVAFPSDFMATLGCANGTTTCWASYIADNTQTVNETSVAWSTNSAGVVTMQIPNNFCPTGGNQYYYSSGTVSNAPCGTWPETITLNGFAASSANPPASGALSWIPDGTVLTITANSANNWGAECSQSSPPTDSNAGSCTAFTGTITGAPNSSSGTVVGTTLINGNGSLQAAPINCLSGVGVNTYCQRPDIWIAKLAAAH